MPGMANANGLGQGSSFSDRTVGTNTGPVGSYSANGTQPNGAMAFLLDGANLVDPGNQGTQIANINQDMTAEVNGHETSRGAWSDARFSFGEMVARASADAKLRPGDLLGSGTVGTGCLLEVRDATLGRYLQPGDEVVLRVEGLGELRTPIVERPAERRP